MQRASTEPVRSGPEGVYVVSCRSLLSENKDGAKIILAVKLDEPAGDHQSSTDDNLISLTTFHGDQVS